MLTKFRFGITVTIKKLALKTSLDLSPTKGTRLAHFTL